MKKRHIAGWIFILLCAAAVFFVGWTQWKVEPGRVGVVMSKTGGIKRECVLPGVFSWSWEFLLPTNARLVTFPTGERTLQRSVTGTLPDSALYSAAAEGAKYDFSYNIEIEFKAMVTADDVLDLCVKGAITDEASLAEYIEKKASAAAEKIAGTLLAASDRTVTERMNLVSKLGNTGADGVTFTDIRLVQMSLPDMNLYEAVRDKYLRDLQAKAQRKDAMQKAVQGLLTQYPELGSGEAGALLRAADSAFASVPSTSVPAADAQRSKGDIVEDKSFTSQSTSPSGGTPRYTAPSEPHSGTAGQRVLRAIRGATGVQSDDEDSVKTSVDQMCASLFKQNALTTKDVVSVVFTVTSDIHCMNPATALRRSAVDNMVEGVDVSAVPLFCAQEPQVDGMASRVIRVMVTAYMDENRAVNTVYINGTQNLRG